MDSRRSLYEVLLMTVSSAVEGQLRLRSEVRSSKYVCILNWNRGEGDQEAVVPRTGKPGLVDPFRCSRVTEWVRMLF